MRRDILSPSSIDVDLFVALSELETSRRITIYIPCLGSDGCFRRPGSVFRRRRKKGKKKKNMELM